MKPLLKRWRLTTAERFTREKWLLVMGFRSFDDYKVSALAQVIKTRVLTRDHSQCRYCGAKTDRVYHLRSEIEDLNGSDISKVVAICSRCLFVEDPKHRTKRLKREKREAIAEQERKRQAAIRKLVAQQNADRFKHPKKTGRKRVRRVGGLADVSGTGGSHRL